VRTLIPIALAGDVVLADRHPGAAESRVCKRMQMTMAMIVAPGTGSSTCNTKAVQAEQVLRPPK